MATDRDAPEEVLAGNTLRLYVFAIGEAISGPPTGTMNLVEDKGANAYVHAVQYYLTPDATFHPDQKTVSDYTEKEDTPLPVLNTTFIHSTQTLYNLQVSNVYITPLLIFLHLDQGCYSTVGYTPFASPNANGRVIHPGHVATLSRGMLMGEPIISSDDFAITAYAIVPTIDKDDDSLAIAYRCMLHHDANSRATVVGKQAKGTTKEALVQAYKRVSSTIIALQTWVIIFFSHSPATVRYWELQWQLKTLTSQMKNSCQGITLS
jgi:uncharacterized protein YuzB (UPF0349 family)